MADETPKPEEGPISDQRYQCRECGNLLRVATRTLPGGHHESIFYCSHCHKGKGPGYGGETPKPGDTRFNQILVQVNEDYGDALRRLGREPRMILDKEQPCGCIVCYCDYTDENGEERCTGCGARNCGTDACVIKAQTPVMVSNPNFKEQEPPPRVMKVKRCVVCLAYREPSKGGWSFCDITKERIYAVHEVLENCPLRPDPERPTETGPITMMLEENTDG